MTEKEEIKSLVRPTLILAKATTILAITTVVLAIVAVCQFCNARRTLTMMRNDSILEHRPYVFVASKGRFQMYWVNNDQVILTIPLTNSGKSAGNDVNFSINKAILVDRKTLKVEGANELFSKDNSENEIDTVYPSREPKISIFPQQKGISLEGIVFNKEGLKDLYKIKQKVIYVWADLTYRGPPFENAEENYKVDYEFMLAWNKVENKMVFNISRCSEASKN